MDRAEARRRFATSTVARLATIGYKGDPHLVPITFALIGKTTLVTAVDHKPKRTTALRRLANIAANPQVSVLVDHYEDDWDRLWWARADGRARVVPAGEEPELRASALSALTGRYRQYVSQPPEGDLIVVEVERFSGWAATYSAGP
ncbi:MAG TPA: TIGR03668 family PPOX class F420-dependent oxidoreductase [Solirubrobacteraceae bacterium]|nr:TIGR03668 family PPOX class F420-dependent oxidoreductase [Solirubrobacteraceae bacterium]